MQCTLLLVSIYILVCDARDLGKDASVKCNCYMLLSIVRGGFQTEP